MSRADAVTRCAIAMRRHQITTDELVARLATLPEIIAKGPSKRETMLQLAARPQGLTTAEAMAECQCSAESALKQIKNLERRGKLQCVRTMGVRTLHWFTDAEHAQRWADRAATPAAPAVPRTRATQAAKSTSLCGTRADGSFTPVAVKKRADDLQGPAIIPRNVRRTLCPSPTHDVRFQVAPGARVTGAGFAAAGIGTDPSTGKPWAR